MNDIDSALEAARRVRPTPLPADFAARVVGEVRRSKPVAALFTPATLGVSFAGAVAVAVAVCRLSPAAPQPPVELPPLAGFSAPAAFSSPTSR